MIHKQRKPLTRFVGGTSIYGLPKAVFKKLLLLQVCLLGALSLMVMALIRGLLSPREFGIIGIVTLFIAFFVSFSLIRNKLAKQVTEPPIALDDDARKRILRGIWMRKVWICVLAVLLPFGIANGVADRAWLPTFVGVGMNLLLMYGSAQQIRRLRDMMHSPEAKSR
jgi:hypothetical protein